MDVFGSGIETSGSFWIGAALVRAFAVLSWKIDGEFAALYYALNLMGFMAAVRL